MDALAREMGYAEVAFFSNFNPICFFISLTLFSVGLTNSYSKIAKKYQILRYSYIYIWRTWERLNTKLNQVE